jgi:hypothetical protein
MTARPEINPPTDDEEEEAVDDSGATSAATRRAYYAGRDDGERRANASFEAAGFRAVPTGKHGGSQTVKPEDTLGSLNFCWCGLPKGHTWPGKFSKPPRPHPRKVQVHGMSTAESTTQHMERSSLRGYNSEVADLVMKAVNKFGVKYKFTNASVVLYPPDGTAPFTVRARNGERGVKIMRRWFAAHCIPEDMSPEEAAAKIQIKDVDAEVVKDLAEAMNSEEHLAKLEEEQKAKAKAKPRPKPAGQDGEPPTPPIATPEAEEPDPENWVPYYQGKGKGHENSAGVKHPYALTNGTEVWCEEHHWLGKPSGLGGHTRTHHRDTTTLWGREAKEKALSTYFTNKAHHQVEEAIELLRTAIGVSASGDVDALTEERDKLQVRFDKLNTENTQLRLEIGDLRTSIAELKAKLALLREAFSNLEE